MIYFKKENKKKEENCIGDSESQPALDLLMQHALTLIFAQNDLLQDNFIHLSEKQTLANKWRAQLTSARVAYLFI